MKIRPTWYKSRFLNPYSCYYMGGYDGWFREFVRILDLSISIVRNSLTTISRSVIAPNSGSSLLSIYRFGGIIGGGDASSEIDRIVRSIDTRTTLGSTLSFANANSASLNDSYQSWSCGGYGETTRVQNFVFSIETSLTASYSLSVGREFPGGYLDSYLVGGNLRTGEDAVNTAINFKKSVGTFTALSSTMSSGRCSFVSGGNRQKLIVIAGLDASYNYLSSVDKLTISTETFSLLNSWPITQSEGASINSQVDLYAISGYNGLTLTDMISIDFSTETPIVRTSVVGIRGATGDISFQF